MERDKADKENKRCDKQEKAPSLFSWGTQESCCFIYYAAVQKLPLPQMTASLLADGDLC